MTRTESDALLAPLALDRVRLLSPLVLIALVASLALSESSGIPLTTASWIYNAIAIPAVAIGTVALARRRIPARWAHVMFVAMWWAPVMGTLIAKASTHSHLTALLFLVELGAAAILLHSRMLLVSFMVANAVWIPLAVRDGSGASLYISSALTAELFAYLAYALGRRSLLRAEVARRGEAHTAARLTEQLAELRRSEDERTRLQEQLLHAQRMETAGTLAAGLAHDMNNVLASITTCAELLQQDVTDAAQRADLASIIAQANRGAELTRALLAFSRRGQYRKRVLRIEDVVREVVPLLTRTLPKTIAISTSIDAPVCVEGDGVQLGQALLNFGLNAADAMDGRGALAIGADVVELTAADAAAQGLTLPAGRYVRLRVTDTGAGMDEATRRRVFEPFFTTKPVGKGTGLGLSTVWGIAQAHGGQASVQSELGRGSTFAIHLPITAQEPGAAAPVRPSVRLVADPRVTVLVVDDEPAVRAGTRRLLERQGLRVLVAGDGAEALRIFDEHAASIGLVILDMGMPVMGGAECFRRLRERSDVPVLVATGYAVESEAQALVAQGAALLEKPVSASDLRREVRRLLRASTAETAA